jgi:hypothetical protein
LPAMKIGAVVGHGQLDIVHSRLEHGVYTINSSPPLRNGGHKIRSELLSQFSW